MKKVLIYFLSTLLLLSACEKPQEKETRKALRRAERYLAAYSSDRNTISLYDGRVAYKVLEEGSGAKVEEHAAPLIHFSEKDLDGEVLYDTQQDGPIRIRLEEAILGFKLGVVGMRLGEAREIVVHPDLAYKKLGKTQPQQLLIYNVKLLEEGEATDLLEAPSTSSEGMEARISTN